MKEQELNRRLAQAVEHAAPNELESVLSRCEERKGTVIYMTEKKRFAVSRRVVSWAAAACLVLALGLGVGYYRLTNTVASVISLDVNPSVALSVNNKQKVLEATAINQDGVQILEGMDLKGTHLNVAINAIVGSLLKNGYVDELANSILITVEDDNATRGAALEESLAGEVDAILTSASVNGAILSQTVTTDQQDLQAKADQYGITLGKATLIQSMVDQNSMLSFEELAGLSVNELNLLASNPQYQPANLTSTGTASDGAYIGVEKAKLAAFTHAGVSAEEVTMGEVDFDYEDGRMVYELEFYLNGVEYEYDVDASNGVIVKYSQDGKQQTQQSDQTGQQGQSQTTAQSGTDIGQETAKQAALSHAGVTADQATNLVVEKDWDDGRLEYKVDFWVDKVEYEYEIDGTTGAVRKNEKETHQNAATQTIGVEQAKTIALQAAGYSADQVGELEVSSELDDRTPHYEVSFKADGMEYEYKIQAQDGTILSQEKDWD